MRWTGRNLGLTLLLFALTIAVWEAVVRILQIPIFILPAPTQVGMALYRGLASGLYVEHLKYTLLETLLGFIVGSALGFFLGTAVAMNRYVEFFFYPYIIMFQSLPKVALAPLIVVWFGLGLTSKVINAALIGAIVAEFVGAQRGLGMLIQSMNFNMDVSGQFSILLILSLVGLLLNRIITLIRRRVMFWDPSEKDLLEPATDDVAAARVGRGLPADAKEGVTP